MEKTIAIVGLGLIGGSLAMALKGFEGHRVVGVVRREATAEYARDHGVGDEVTLDAAGALRRADMTVLCINPKDIVSFLEEHKEEFKPGSLVTDVCGIKSAVMAAAEILPDHVDFIGGHPMAGTEFSGIEHALPDLFRSAHYLITPRADSRPEHIALLERMAAYIGCKDVVKTTPEEHDDIIAYTSQMMHIIAVSVCDDESLFSCQGFEGSSFRGCTRVADLDVELWTQLFSMNTSALGAALDRLADNLDSYRAALRSGDTELLRSKLSWSAGRKHRTNLGERSTDPYYV